ncbi:6,7,8-trihydroxycoumarin synthase-like [Gastrolobium bilobum]|uniref:6,7,8-trihydroxycoumarin synthase-like n=2 Tax=Gastrolobium bilobum TaxID=150636 RepID=UPI002AB02474|nr:6,7,8-trihydroxycoumarin synthase-like [Gastrolobium bilobum]
MVSFLHLLLALPLLVWVLLQLYKTIKNPSTRPPGPKGLPIIGNLHQLDSSNLHFQLWKLSKIYGSLFSLQIGFKQAIVISTPKLAKEVLKDHDHDVCSRPPSTGQQKLSYNGLEMIFSPYNEYWREIRKICVVHFFSSKRISSFSHVRKFEVKQMIKKISGHANSSKVTNLSEIIMSVSSATICRMAFGRKYEEEGAERSKFHGLLNESQAMFLSFFVSDYIPFMGWIDKLTGLFSRLENTHKALDVFFQQVIEEHLNPNRQKETEDEDIVDVLLQLKKQGRLSIDLTNDHIKAVIMDILVAATDTSAATSVWVMTGLMKNPRVMKKAQEEVRSLYGKKEFIDEDDIQKLEYLKAVIKETLRFYAPAPLVPRETNKSFIIDGYEIQPKTLVYVNVWAIQRDPEAWKDPEEFYPERFLNNDIDFKGQDFELIPFGAGRRICPGIPLGIATVELITANLLNLFDCEMPAGLNREDIDTDGLPGLARHKKNHLCLVAKNYM